MNVREKYTQGIVACLMIFSIALLLWLKAPDDLKYAPSRFITGRAFAYMPDKDSGRAALRPSRSYEDSTTGDGGAADAVLSTKVELLERGKTYLQGVTDYAVTLTKRELVGQELLDEQTIRMKCRHRPFSVYLYWEKGDIGREVLFVEGSNNGHMIAHDGGWRARIPAFSLSPTCSLAMHDARYPVTKAGMLGLIDTMLGVHREDLARSNAATCEMDPNGEFDGRACVVFTTKYKSKSLSPQYRKSVTYIDKQWNIPIFSQHFDWPENEEDLADRNLDEATLVESYAFTKIKMGCGLTDSDFDRHNPKYHFH